MEDYQYEDYKVHVNEDTSEADNTQRRQKTNEELLAIEDHGIEEQRIDELSSMLVNQQSISEQHKQSEEVANTGDGQHGSVSSDCCIVDEGLDNLPLEGSKSKVWNYFGFEAVNGKYREEDKKEEKR